MTIKRRDFIKGLGLFTFLPVLNIPKSDDDKTILSAVDKNNPVAITEQNEVYQYSMTEEIDTVFHKYGILHKHVHAPTVRWGGLDYVMCTRKMKEPFDPNDPSSFNQEAIANTFREHMLHCGSNLILFYEANATPIVYSPVNWKPIRYVLVRYATVV